MSESVLPYGGPEPEPAPPQQVAHCRSCGAEVVWVTVAKTGSKMICDVAGATFIPCPSGTVASDADRRLSVIASGGGVWLRTPHWATCPNAAEHRRAG